MNFFLSHIDGNMQATECVKLVAHVVIVLGMHAN